MEKIGSYKVILIGDGGTGKTSFITRYIEGYFTKQYVATIGAEVYNLNLPISPTQFVHFEVWDTAGQEANSGLSDAYYLNANAAVVFFDLTARVTFSHVPSWIQKVKNIIRDTTVRMIPICVVGNKADLSRDRKVDAIRIRKGIPKGCEYYDMSAKSNYNFEKPFLYLVRELLGRPEITFGANIQLQPATLQITKEAIDVSNEIAKQLEAAKNVEFEDDEEDEFASRGL